MKTEETTWFLYGVAAGAAIGIVVVALVWFIIRMVVISR